MKLLVLLSIVVVGIVSGTTVLLPYQLAVSERLVRIVVCQDVKLTRASLCTTDNGGHQVSLRAARSTHDGVYLELSMLRRDVPLLTDLTLETPHGQRHEYVFLNHYPTTTTTTAMPWYWVSAIVGSVAVVIAVLFVLKVFPSKRSPYKTSRDENMRIATEVLGMYKN